MTIEAVLTALVEPICDELGVSLYDLTYSGSVVQVLVHADDGIDVEVLKKVSRKLSNILDEKDPIPGRFTLEISSPGLERPLRIPAHFVGALGETVSIKTKPGVDGDRRTSGTLLSADEHQVTVNDGDAKRTLSYDDILKARTVFVWESAPKPGKGTTTESEARKAVSS